MNLKQSLAKSMLKGFAVFSLLVFFGAYVNANQTVEFGGDREVVEGSAIEVFSNTDCDTVPEGEFPTGAIVQHIGGGTEFTDKPVKVSKAFDFALGKSWVGVNGVTLCK